MFAHIRLAHKKGLLQGSLNMVQEEALQWIMVDEIRQAVELERERMKYTILGGNIDLYRALWPDEEENESEVPPDEAIEWITPQTGEEIEKIIQLLEAGDRASESFS